MKKIKFLNFILCFIVLFGCLCFLNLNNVSASTSTFNEFEIGQTFAVGDRISVNNSNGVVPSKTYSFSTDGIGPGSGYIFTLSIFLNDNNEFVFSVTDGTEVFASGVMADYFDFLEFDVPMGNYWELTDISNVSGSGLLGFNASGVEPNYIYQGVYDLLGNLIYGSTENLSTTQIGNLEFISQIIVIFCVLLPFIILLWVINRLFKF